MQKVAVVTDSIACLTKDFTTQYGIEVVPINLYAGGKIYRDGVDLAASEAYELFLADPDSFKTSAASPEVFLQVFREVSKRVRAIVCITVSAKLSMMADSARKAKELARTELPQTPIEVIDSCTAAAAEGMVAVAAARAASSGKDLDGVIAEALRVKDKVHYIVFLDTIKHVYRSGRIPKIASQIGSALNLKPLLVVAESVHFTGMVRSHAQGIERMIRMIKDRVGDKPVRAAVTHAYAPEEAERLRERVAKEFNCIELWTTEFSPVMGYACGTGTVGIAYYAED
ncbi:MAG: DegV family protein [Dehalococcoidales bacterium]|nr:DegV family protein [Dehalococcoidales bacterium]